jgi:hypothetical protein
MVNKTHFCVGIRWNLNISGCLVATFCVGGRCVLITNSHDSSCDAPDGITLILKSFPIEKSGMEDPPRVWEEMYT